MKPPSRKNSFFFAVDTALVASPSETNDIGICSADVRSLDDWCYKNRQSLNSTKCKIFYFGESMKFDFKEQLFFFAKNKLALMVYFQKEPNLFLEF